MFKSEFTDIFPSAIIQKQKVRTVSVYSETSDTTSRPSTARSLEMKFAMDTRGWVTSETGYNAKGKAHSIYEFERSTFGLTVKQTFTYLDSLGKKSFAYLDPEVIEYTYDVKNRLTKIKERDSKGRVVIDEKADYSTFQYDDRGRVIKELKQYYFDGNGPEKTVYTTVFSYSNDNSTRESRVYENGKLVLTTKMVYNKFWKPIKEEQYPNLMNQPSSITLYKYDSMNRLIYYDAKAGNGSVSECPDGGTFNETYEYDNKGLLSKIAYSFEGKICVITLEYN